MEIEYQNTKTDYHNFYQSFFSNRLKKRGWIEVLICLVISFCFSLGTGEDWHDLIIVFVVTVILFFLLFYLRPYLLSIKRINNAIAKDKRFTEKKKVKITDEGILLESLEKSVKCSWLHISSVKAYDTCLYIILVDKSSILVPKRSFPSEQEEIHFLEKVESGITTARETLHTSLQQFSPKKKAPYLLGLICLAPILGGYAGFVILLFGILKYRDKWFSLIGVAGMLWTYIFIQTIPYAPRYIPFIRSGYETLSQIDLNALLKNIEFYKLQHGEYPDSLKQLLREDSTASITDPIRVNLGNQKQEFNYEKMGNKYILYSSGEDGIPHTKDDLYPHVAITDSTRIGLVRQGQNSP